MRDIPPFGVVLRLVAFILVLVHGERATLAVAPCEQAASVWQFQRLPTPEPKPLTAPADVELTYAAAYARGLRGETMVVVLGADWCQPCRATWSDLQPLRRRLALVHVEFNSPDGRKLSSGSTIPQVIVYRRVLGVWREVRHTGPRTLRQVEAAIESLERRPTPAPAKPPQQAPADKASNASVAGVPVYVAGQFFGVAPDTLAMWRLHLRQDHGIDPTGMSPQQLAQAHADAHARQGSAGGERRGLFGRRW